MGHLRYNNLKIEQKIIAIRGLRFSGSQIIAIQIQVYLICYPRLVYTCNLMYAVRCVCMICLINYSH